MARVQVRHPRRSDERAFLAAVRRSRELHRPWVKPPDTPDGFRRYLKSTRGQRDIAFVICANAGELAGVVNVSQIVHGVFRSAYLGYYALVPHAGSGLMKRGMALTISKLFGEHKLHRLEANIQPQNLASIGLVTRLGFRREGYSPRYLKIGGRWRDHERWALLSEDWRSIGIRSRTLRIPDPPS